jgi:hypothetical protein
MTSPIPVPILGTQGFASDPVTKFSTLMAHLYVADAKQSQLYAGHVTTLAEIMQESGNDTSLVVANLKTKLTSYFQAYYDSATVAATIMNIDEPSGALTVRLDIRVFDQGQENSMSWRFDAADNVISNVLRLSNYGG